MITLLSICYIFSGWCDMSVGGGVERDRSRCVSVYACVYVCVHVCVCVCVRERERTRESELFCF